MPSSFSGSGAERQKTDFFLFKCTTCVELSLLLLFISKFLCGSSSLSDCSAFQRVPFTASNVALEHFCSLRERMVFSLKSFSLSSASDLIIWAPFVLPLSGQRRGGWNNCSCTIGAVDQGIQEREISDKLTLMRKRNICFHSCKTLQDEYPEATTALLCLRCRQAVWNKICLGVSDLLPLQTPPGL